MADDEDFCVRFWGVRGSVPCPGRATARYGGNTSCLEVRCGSYLLIFDAGTGLRLLDDKLRADGPVDADVFLTHTHLDHIWGWPFFTSLLEAENTCTVWAGHLRRRHSVDRVLGRLLRDPFSPVRADNMGAKLTYRHFAAGESLEPRPGVTVRTAPLNHPNRATGYRVEFHGRSICYVTDTEHVRGESDANVLTLIRNADIVVYDSTYTDEEFQSHISWGHSTWEEGVRLCEVAAVKTLVAFHHDPDHDDAFMDGVAAALERVRPGSIVAREGMTLRP